MYLSENKIMFLFEKLYCGNYKKNSRWGQIVEIEGGENLTQKQFFYDKHIFPIAEKVV